MDSKFKTAWYDLRNRVKFIPDMIGLMQAIEDGQKIERNKNECFDVYDENGTKL